jgi:hypothetical protein
VSRLNSPDVRDDPQDAFARLRLQSEFERMLWAVVQAALIAGIVRLAIALLALLAGRSSVSGALGGAVASFEIAAIVFLAGFLAVAVAGAPLARYLDAGKIGLAWPFYALGAAAAFCAMALLSALPSYDSPYRIIYAAPGLLAAHLYACDRAARRARSASRALH